MSDIEDDVDDSGAANSGSRSKRKHRALEDDAHDVEDEDEEEAEDDDEEDEEYSEDEGGGGGGGGGGSRARPAKRVMRSRFIDDVADVDDEEDSGDDEDDEDGEPGADRFIANEPEGHEGPRLQEALARYRNEDEMLDVPDEEQVNEYYRQRERHYQAGESDEVLDQHSLLPSVSDDPKLWMVKCQAGMEKDLVCQLMSKFLALQLQGQTLAITSAFCHETPPAHYGSKREGRVYVEAMTEKGVQDSVDGIRGFLRMRGIQRVPHGEMTEAINVKDVERKELPKDSWVRVVGGGLYKGDLAQVVRFDQDESVMIKMVPRLDYAELAKRAEDRKAGKKPLPFGGHTRLAKGQMRPAPAPFSLKDAQNAGQVVEPRRGHDNMFVMNNKTYQDGYELRRVSLRAVDAVKEPTMEEVQRFLSASVGTDNADHEHTLLALAGARTTTFDVGDTVVVATGDLANLKGKVVELDHANGSVLMQPEDLPGFSERLDFKINELQKFINLGARVKVVGGSHHVGDLGVVTHNADGLAEVLMDGTDTTVSFPLNNLAETSATQTALRSLGRYSLHDLVKLTDGSVGMIVSVSAQAAEVLLSGGETSAVVRTVRLPDIAKAMPQSKRIPAPDCMRQRVVANSLVEIVDGPFKDKTGTVSHVDKPNLWVQVREISQYNGHVVVMSNMVRLKGGAKRPGGGMGYGGLGGMTPSYNPTSPAIGLKSPGFKSPAYPGAMGGGMPAGLQSPRLGQNPSDRAGGMPGGGRFGGGGGGGGGGRFGGRGRGGRGGAPVDTLVKKRVRVVKGAQYRGYRGTVQYANETHIRLELDATNKVVTMPRGNVMLDNGQTAAVGSTPGRSAAAPAQSPAALPPRTPMHGGAKTPAYVPSYSGQPMRALTPADTLPAQTPGVAPFTPAATPMPDTPAAPVDPTPASVATPGPALAAPTPAMTPAMTPGTARMLDGGVAMTPGTMARTPFGATPGTGFTSGAAERPSRGPAYSHYVDVQVLIGMEKAVVISYDHESDEVCVAHGEEAANGIIDVQSDSRQQLVPAASVKLAPADKNDQVKLVASNQGVAAGAVGVLIGHDNEDGIVKIADAEQILILPKTCIAKLNVPPMDEGM